MNIDLLDPASFADGQPHEQYRWLRDNAPVYRHPEPDGPGFWAVTRYDDVRDVGRDPEHYSSMPTILIPDMAAIDFGDHQMMITSDPPRHTRLRRIINSQFTPRAAEALRLRIEELAAEIIDAVIERGECDAVTDIAGEMPSFVIAELLGIPLDDGRQLYHLTETIHAAPESVPEGAGLTAIIEMFNYARQVAEEKRAHPGDDLASRILGAEVDGERLDDIDFNLFFLLLIDAGGDTTRNLVGGGLVALFDHPDQRRRLQDDLDGMLPSAVDEMLRWVSPVVYMRRTATQDCDLAGTPIATGRQGRHVLRLRQPRRARHRRARPLRRRTRAERPDRLRWRRTALLPRLAHRARRDPGAAPRAAHAAARHRPRRPRRVAGIELHLRPQAPAGAIHPRPARHRLTGGSVDRPTATR